MTIHIPSDRLDNIAELVEHFDHSSFTKSFHPGLQANVINTYISSDIVT